MHNLQEALADFEYSTLNGSCPPISIVWKMQKIQMGNLIFNFNFRNFFSVLLFLASRAFSKKANFLWAWFGILRDFLLAAARAMSHVSQWAVGPNHFQNDRGNFFRIYLL